MSAKDFQCDVAIVCPHMGDGGSQRVINMLAQGWLERGWRVSILTLFGDVDTHPVPDAVERIAVWPLRRTRGRLGSPQRDASTRPRVLPLRWLGRWELFRALRFHAAIVRRVWALRRALAQLRPRRIVTFLTEANVMTLLATRGRPVRVVISERNDPNLQDQAPLLCGLRQLTYRWADAVTANSRGALHAMRSYVASERLQYVPNPLLHPSAPREDECLREPLILSVGRLHAQKAHDVLLGAFAQLPEHLNGWRLAVVGRGPLERALRDQAVSLGIADRIEWAGYTENPEPYYRRASIFALPSRFEGMPNALLEALAHAVPAIVSDASLGPGELLSHDESGVFARVGDATELAVQLTKLAEDPELRARLGNAGRRAVQGFTLPGALDAWEEVLEL